LHSSAVKIRFKTPADVNDAKYFIQNDKKSDKKFKYYSPSTIIVNAPTALLLRDIGLSFLVDDYSDEPLT
jgi:hypothetical protein